MIPPRFAEGSDEALRRLEFAARNMCEGICVWICEIARPAAERSPTVLAHEVARAQRMADVFETRVADPLMQDTPSMAQLILAVALDVAAKRGFGDLTTGRPQLAAWMRSMSELPSVRRRSHSNAKKGRQPRCPVLAHTVNSDSYLEWSLSEGIADMARLAVGSTRSRMTLRWGNRPAACG